MHTAHSFLLLVLLKRIAARDTTTTTIGSSSRSSKKCAQAQTTTATTIRNSFVMRARTRIYGTLNPRDYAIALFHHSARDICFSFLSSVCVMQSNTSAIVDEVEIKWEFEYGERPMAVWSIIIIISSSGHSTMRESHHRSVCFYEVKYCSFLFRFIEFGSVDFTSVKGKSIDRDNVHWTLWLVLDVVRSLLLNFVRCQREWTWKNIDKFK